MTATGFEAQIADALIQRLKALVLDPALQVAFPNVVFPTAGEKKPDTYLDAHLLRVPTRGVGISSWDERAGILQVDVVYKAQDGGVKPLEIADAVAAWFPRGTRLTNGDVRVDVYNTPEIASPISDAPYTRTPVSIRYRSFTP